MAVAYVYDGVMYLAVTRRCTLHCTFCPKTHGIWTVAGNDLSRDAEPTAQQLLAAADAAGLAPQQPVAFVGLGEPTMRLDVVVEVGRALRARGHRVRLVTDGLANLRAGTDVTPRLADAMDEVNVSLNAQDGETYARVCPNPHGAQAHAHVCRFVELVRQHVPAVVATVVVVDGVDVRACRALAAGLGVPLRARPYFDPATQAPHDPGTNLSV